MGKTAIIIGATGATGENLLRLLLTDNRYEKIKLFSRSSCHINNPKIEEHLGNLFELENFSKDFTGDEVYCTIGTTQKQTPDKDLYTRIDFGIPVAAAELAKKNNIDVFMVMSSMGANSDSTTFYTKTKGEMENAISKLNIPKIYILRPSLLLRKTKESRLLESLGGQVMKLTSFLFLGPLKKYRAIKTDTVSRAMIRIANSNQESKLFLSDEIQSLGS